MSLVKIPDEPLIVPTDERSQTVIVSKLLPHVMNITTFTFGALTTQPIGYSVCKLECLPNLRTVSLLGDTRDNPDCSYAVLCSLRSH